MDIRKAVLLAQNGDQEGFNWLYRETVNRCHYVAMRYMKQEELANDVLQDAYIKAYFNLNQLQEPEKFSAWMARIVVSKALDELKKKKVILFSQLEGEEDNKIDVMFEDNRIDTQPELAYDKKEIEELVKEMIDTLSDEQRICIMMFYLEEMSIKEIAEAIGCSENTIKSRLNYGRKNIKEKVLELEKKGIKLRSVSPFAFFLHLLLSDYQNVLGEPANFEVFEKMQEQIKYQQEIAKINANKKASTLGKRVSNIVSKKVIIGVVAVIVTTVGIVTLIHNLNQHQEVAQVEQSVPEVVEIEVQEEVIPEETVEEVKEEEEVEQVSVEQEVLEAYKVLLSQASFNDYGFQVIHVNGMDAPILILIPKAFAAKTLITGEVYPGEDVNEIEMEMMNYVVCYFDIVTKEVKQFPSDGTYGYDLDEDNDFINQESKNFAMVNLSINKEGILLSEWTGSTLLIEGYVYSSDGGNLEKVMEYADAETGDWENTISYYNNRTGDSGTIIYDSEKVVIQESGEIPTYEEVIGEKLTCYRNIEEMRNQYLGSITQ